MVIIKIDKHNKYNLIYINRTTNQVRYSIQVVSKFKFKSKRKHKSNKMEKVSQQQERKYDTSFRLLDFNIYDEKRDNEEDQDGGPDNDDADGAAAVNLLRNSVQS